VVTVVEFLAHSLSYFYVRCFWGTELVIVTLTYSFNPCLCLNEYHTLSRLLWLVAIELSIRFGF